jgi:subtilisin family serine protease
MHRHRVLVPWAVLALLVSLMWTQTASAADSRSVIVVFQDGVSAQSTTQQLERQHGFVASQRYTSALHGFAARLPAAVIARIAADPNVAFISEDRPVHAISVPIAAGDSAPTGVRRIGAATTTTAHAASTVAVAIIDTGIQLNHPDLNAVTGKSCQVYSLDANDDHGHGTHVAGTIGAKNNGSGVVGVAPGTTLYAVKVLNLAGAGLSSDVICGIDWVTANASRLGIKVASMSLGGSGSIDSSTCATTTDAQRKAICNSTAAGVTYVVAAGNSTADLATTTPAAYPEVLTVTAMTDSDGKAGHTGGAPACRTTESDDTAASYSNYATASREIAHTVAGPGTCIYSTWTMSGYNTISGTSMATPHVSGTVALCFGSGGVAGPCAGLTPAQVIAKIRSDAQAAATPSNGFTGDPNAPNGSRYYGYLVAAGGY